MAKLSRWQRSYHRAMGAEPGNFVADSRAANQDVAERLKAIGLAETMEEVHERDAALLALADLRVLTSAFWNRLLRAMN